jgi:small subunit ribosomal protein S15
MATIKAKELEVLIEKLAKEHSPEKIGLILRDQHGVPSVKAVLGKRLTQVLKEKNIKFKTEKEKMEEKSNKLKSHIEKNKHDYSASRALTKKLWRILKYKS